MLTLNIEQRRHILGFEAEGRRSPIQARTGRRIAHAPENMVYFCMRLASGCLRPAETHAKMRSTGGFGRQSAADGRRKRSPTGTRRKSRASLAMRRPALLFHRRPPGLWPGSVIEQPPDSRLRGWGPPFTCTGENETESQSRAGNNFFGRAKIQTFGPFSASKLHTPSLAAFRSRWLKG